MIRGYMHDMNLDLMHICIVFGLDDAWFDCIDCSVR